MKKNEREKILIEKLHLNKKIELNEAVEMLNVSESTARRIFNELEENGKAIRTHGGIVPALGNNPEYSFELLMKSHFDEKMAIGELAAAEIQDGDIVYLDCGTTVLSLCFKIALLLREGYLKNTQFFSNSLANLEVLAPITQVNLIGGRYRPNRKDFSGYTAEIILRELHFTKAFLGTDGISPPICFNATDFDTARLNQLVIAGSERVYVLCDYSKFGKRSLISYANAEDVDAVISDGKIEEASVEMLEAAGIRMIKTAN